MKARRRVVPGKATPRRPTVRRIRPAIAPALPRVRLPEPAPAAHPGAPATRSTEPAAAAGLAPRPDLDALGGRPVELAVDLGRGLVLANPLLGASGAYGYGSEVADAVPLGRLGALVTRSTTRKARPGNPPPRMSAVPGGLLNAVGLQNPGIDAVVERYAPAWPGLGTPVIVSLAGETPGDYAECARRLEGVPGVAGVELNLGCAAQGRGGTVFALDATAAASVVAAVRRATELPVLAKLSPGAADVREVARAVEDAGADAITAVNTLAAVALAPDRGAPALGVPYGGLSGPALRPVALRVVFEIAGAVDVPVVAAGGAATLDDVLDFLAAGAVAVQVATAALADPGLPMRLADELAAACRERGLGGVTALVGTALPARLAPPSARGAEYRP